MFVRVNIGNSDGDGLDQLQLPALSFAETERTATRTATAGMSSILSSLVHDIRVNVSIHRGWRSAGPLDEAAAVPLDLLPGSSRGRSHVSFNLFPGPGGLLSSGQIGPNSRPQVEVVDTLTLVRGRHEWRAGVNYRHVLAASDGPREQVLYRFGGVDELLQGRVRQIFVQTVAPSKALFQSWSAFAQDTFRLSARLSLDYGIRYSVEPAPVSRTELSPLLIDFDRLPEVSELSQAAPLWNTSWTNVAPRVAASYILGTRADRETVLRAGWSLVFDQLTRPGAVAIGRTPPYVGIRTIGTSAFPVPADSLVVIPVEPFSPGDRGQYYAFPRDLRTPRTYNWRLGIDQALGSRQRLSAAYVGAAGRDLVYWSAHYAGNPTPVINAYSNDGRSNYLGLLAEYVRQMSRGFAGRVAYTFSHAIDNDSGESLRPYVPPSLISPSLNRGPSDFDRPHVFQAMGSYEFIGWWLPRRLQPVLSQWQIDVSTIFQSGAPFSVATAGQFGNGTYVIRPDVVPGVPVWIPDETSATGRSLNAAAFEVPTQARQGTLGRNTLRASPLRQVDVLVTKTIRFGGTMSAQLRVQAFNVFNTSNVGPPYVAFPSPQFGRPSQTHAQSLGTGTLTQGGLVPIQQTGGPRLVQIGLRFSM